MKRYIILFATLISIGCGLEPGSQILILNAPNVETGSCLFQAGGVVLSTGVFDSTLAESFRLGLVMRNYIANSDFDKVSLTGSQDGRLRPDANAATVIGFDTCFYREDDPSLNVTALGPKGQAVVDCASLPVEQQRFIPSSAFLPPGTEKDAIVEIHVLRHDDLRVLFGPAFDPEALGPSGPRWEDTNQNGVDGDAGDDIIYDFRSPDPRCATVGGGCSPQRSAAWGNYPESRVSRVVVQVTAQLKLQTGRAIGSNEFVFPIELQTGMLLDACEQPAYLVQCSTICPEGPCPATGGRTINQQRACVIDTPDQCESECAVPINGAEVRACRPFAFSGARPNTFAKCLVSQGVMRPLCAGWDACRYRN